MKSILAFIVLILLWSNLALSEDDAWKISSGNIESHKFSKLKEINQTNIQKLEVAWTYRSGYKNPTDKNRRNNQTTPIFTGTSIIISSIDGFLISVNPLTGIENWRTKLRNPVGKRGLNFYEKNIFVPTSEGIVIVNELNGKINKDFGKEGFIGYYGEDFLSLVPPIIDNNNLLVAHQKKIESYALPSGKTNWSLKLNGARIWSPFSYDKSNKTIVAVTSNLFNLIGTTVPNPDYSNSVLLIDSETGKIRCKFKDTILDHWDLDMTGSPIIHESMIKNKIKSLAYAFSKNGNIFIIDIKNCKLINEDSIKIIKTDTKTEIPNQTYSNFQKEFTKPKQIIDLSYDLNSYISYLEKNKKSSEYIKFATRNSVYGKKYIPLSIEKDVLMYGIHGGFEWPGGTLDLLNNQLIISSNHYPWILRTFYTEKKKQSFDVKKYFSTSIGEKLYKSNCQSCHGSNREGIYEGEFFGSKYVPSLVGISLKKRFDSLSNLSNFTYEHKYINDKINISDSDLSELRKFFMEKDKKAKNNLNLDVNGKWQLLLNDDGTFASEPPWGKITAFDLETYDINWQMPFGFRMVENNKKILGDINFGGLLSTEGNILFATGTPDKFIRGYSSENGKELWSHKMDQAGSAPPMTFFFEGNQYLIVNASGGRYYGYEKDLSDYIYAFKLKKN